MQRLGPAIDAAFGRPRAVLAISAHTAGARAGAAGRARGTTRCTTSAASPTRLYALRYDAPGRAGAGRRRCEALLRRAGIAGAPRRARRAGPRHLDAAALHVPGRRRAGAAAGLRAQPGARRSCSRSARRWRRWPRGRAGDGHAAASRTTCAASSRGGLRRHADAPRDRRERAPSATGCSSAASAATGTRCSTTAAQRRTRWTCTPPTSTCCPGTSAAGAGGRDAHALRLHDSLTFGSLGMDSYAFGPARRAAATRALASA